MSQLADTNKRAAIAVLDYSYQNLIMVKQRASLKWGVPKGHLQENERLWEGALRELEEETGLSLSKTRYNFICRDRSLFVVRLIEPYSADRFKIDQDELLSVEWVPLTKLKERLKSHPQEFNMWMRFVSTNLGLIV